MGRVTQHFSNVCKSFIRGHTEQTFHLTTCTYTCTYGNSHFAFGEVGDVRYFCRRVLFSVLSRGTLHLLCGTRVIPSAASVVLT